MPACIRVLLTAPRARCLTPRRPRRSAVGPVSAPHEIPAAAFRQSDAAHLARALEPAKGARLVWILSSIRSCIEAEPT
jgi:hypothetical protein